MKKLNLIGHKFGRLTPVLRLFGNRQERASWECLCDCGNEVTIVTNQLTSGRTKSCGCLKTARRYATIAIEKNIFIKR